MPNTNMIIMEDLEKAAKPEQLADDSNVVKKQKLNLEKLENDLDVDANLLCMTTKSDDLYKMKKVSQCSWFIEKILQGKKNLAGDYEAAIENTENELSSFKKNEKVIE